MVSSYDSQPGSNSQAISQNWKLRMEARYCSPSTFCHSLSHEAVRQTHKPMRKKQPCVLKKNHPTVETLGTAMLWRRRRPLKVGMGKVGFSEYCHKDADVCQREIDVQDNERYE